MHLNKFGTEFTLADQLFFDQVIETAMRDNKIKEAVEVNSYENFMHYYGKMMESLFISLTGWKATKRYSQN